MDVYARQYQELPFLSSCVSTSKAFVCMWSIVDNKDTPLIHHTRLSTLSQHSLNYLSVILYLVSSSVMSSSSPSPTSLVLASKKLQYVAREPKQTMITDRHGRKVPLSFDSITERNRLLAQGLDRINLTLVTERVIADRLENMTTSDLDALSIQACEDLELRDDPQYCELASAIAWSNLVKSAPATFGECAREAIEAGIMNQQWATFVLAHTQELEAMIHSECFKEENDPTHLRDWYSYLAYNMLSKTYLLRLEVEENQSLKKLADGSELEAKKQFRVIERPSYALLRVAIQLHMPDLNEINRCVQRFFNRSVCPATPVWQYSGMLNPCLASCNLYTVDDSLLGIQKSWIQMSTISARGGGLGGSWSRLRTKNSIIHSSQGTTTSAVGWCDFAQSIARLVNQGGKRAGSNAVYFDIVHGDIMDLIHLKSPNAGKDDLRCPDLHTAIWCCDAFFARLEYQVEHDTETVYWPTFNPQLYPELIQLWGPDKTRRIEELEAARKYVERVPIMNIWNAYLAAIGDKGEPYLLNGCTVNAKSSHINMGTVVSSNLCSEIVQFHDPDHVAVCILSSLCLPSNNTITPNQPTPSSDNTIVTNTHGLQYIPSPAPTPVYGFTFHELEQDVRQLVRNLTATSMRGQQAIPECKANNDLMRAIAIGVQGLADTLANLHMPFDSAEAFKLNQLIHEHAYFYALDESNRLVDDYGPYPAWTTVSPTGDVPPLKLGLFHWQLKGVQPAPMKSATDSCANSLGASPGITPLTLDPKGGEIRYTPDPINERGRHRVHIKYEHLDWDGLRARIMENGVANSMVIGLMPTMSTSKIMGWTDSFEPSENLVVFKNNATSSSTQVFKPLYNDLHRLGLYSTEVFNHMKGNGGSIQGLDLPADVQWLKEVYKTVYEVSPTARIKLATSAQAFVDQSMSLNVYFKIATKALCTTWHLTAWRAGLKTNQYYLRSQPATTGAKVGTSGTRANANVGVVVRAQQAKPSTQPTQTTALTPVKKAIVVKKPTPQLPNNVSEQDEAQCSVEARRNGVDCDTCSG